MPSVLHVGCGPNPLPAWLSDHTEVRLDIDPDCEPHIVASMTDLGDIGPFDTVYSSHSLEHLFAHDAEKAVAEFHRVLKPGGYAIIIVPDLEDVKPDDTVLYDSLSGPVRGVDLYYGFAKYVALSPFMAHRTGFVRDTFARLIETAGFTKASVDRLTNWNLMAVAQK